MFQRITYFFFNLIFLCLSLNPFASTGQTIDHEAFGCHVTHQRIAGIKYTPEELAYAQAALERSDTFDILEYRINLNVTDFQSQRILGFTEVDFRPLMTELDHINLDLERLNVDSIIYLNEAVSYTHNGPLLRIQFTEALDTARTYTLRVYYGGVPMTSSSGFGGFYFENGYAYNLGIGIRDKPHNYGRAWFPCFDNFVERSTYEYHITHNSNHMAYCVGTFMGTDTIGNGLLRTSYRMEQPIPTYLSSIAISNYTHLDFDHQGMYGTVPVRLISRPGDLQNFENSFAQIGDAIDVFEKWYGPYPFERVGYVITTRGAMEHPTNVAYPVSAIANGAPDNRLMAHELCHHWWGNIVTLSTSHNMWIKEGPAEYGAHLFTEYAEGPEAFKAQLKANAMNVLRRAHIDDGGFLALSPMPEDKTYGTHTYRKGAMMLHNLRGYLGDEDYSSSMKSVLERYAYDNVDAYSFRDQLMASAGKDLVPFFDDWIFSPGYPTFEIDSIKIEPIGTSFELTLFIEQKLYGRTAPWFREVPLHIQLRNANWEPIFDFKASVSGQYDQVKILANRIPSFVMLNPDQKLNLAFMTDELRTSEAGNYFLSAGLMRFRYLSGSGEVKLAVEHHFAGADDFTTPDENIRMGRKRHWKVKGIEVPAGIDYWAEVEYTAAGGFDDDLVRVTEDSIILIWRPNPAAQWIEHPNYQKRRLASNDGQGFMRIFDLLPGEYAFANGQFLNTSTKLITPDSKVYAYPNPFKQELHVEVPEYWQNTNVRILSTDGKVIWNKNKITLDEKQSATLHLGIIPAGTYLMELSDENTSQIHTVRVVKE